MPIHTRWLIAAFVAKILAGLAYGYIYQHYYIVSDSWTYYKESLTDYHDLLHNPAAFFQTNGKFNHLTDFFSTADNAFWNNAGENMLIKLLGICNIFSAGNYYVDSIMLNCISFAGFYYIYITAIYYLRGNNLALFITIFFLPSSLFWNSGVDKEILIVAFAACLIYSVHKCMSDKIKIGRMIALLAGFAGILIMRNVNAFLFLPAIAAWWCAEKHSKRPYLPFIVMYAACFAIFFLTTFTRFNLPLKLAEKQHQFIALEANTRLDLTALQPTLTSYLQVLPQAINHTILRPYPNEITTPFHLLALAENILILVIIVWALLAGKQVTSIFNQPFSLFLLALAISGILLIGYTVPFTGAIIRYKALYIVFFLLPFACHVNMRKTKFRKKS
ncbi:MAG: hypothetical protein QM802_01795 [Agriterribacter sp.]